MTATGKWIEHWDPEDETFWREDRREGRPSQSPCFSVLSEHIGFSIWTLWSVLVLFMGPEYGLTPADKFLLTSMVTLVGAVVRVPYTFAVAIFGGRNWTIVSASPPHPHHRRVRGDGSRGPPSTPSSGSACWPASAAATSPPP
ncbi:hypothetical protein ACRAWF_35710 [Streptomyces sp. L7]